MGRKDTGGMRIPVEGYRKQLGKQESRRAKPSFGMRHRREVGFNIPSTGFKDSFLVIMAIALIVLCVYAFFYLNLSTEVNLDLDVD